MSWIKNESSNQAPVQLFHLFFIWIIVLKGVPTPLQHGDMVRPFLSDIHPFALEEKGTFKCNVQQPMNNDTP